MTVARDDTLDALYSVSLDGFIAARKDIATRLKKSGDPTKAAAVLALPKPTASAWVTNDLHRSAHDEISALLDLGVRLRGAMRAALRGSKGADDVGMLQREQRDRVEALVELARERLTENALSASDAVLSRVRTNLTALSTSGSWGPTAPGHMSKDLEPLDMASLAALLDVAEPAPREMSQAAPVAEAKKPSASSAEEEARRAAIALAEKARADALEDVDRATQAWNETRARSEEATAKANGLREQATSTAARIEDIERSLRAAREEAETLRRASEAAASSAQEAKHSLERTSRDVERAETRLRAATEALDSLGRGDGR